MLYSKSEFEGKDICTEELKFNSNSIENLNASSFILEYPVVYLIFDDNSIYIGETKNLKTRMKNHMKNNDRKKLKKVLIYGSDKFNKSATYNIETNLINNFIADNKFKLQNKSQIKQRVMHNYYQKNLYDKVIFSEIWESLLEKKLVDNTLENIANMDVFKLSPYKELSDEQIELKLAVLKFIDKNIKSDSTSVYTIQGEAGTGKSVVISSLFNTIQDKASDINDAMYATKNYLLVNHEEMIKTYRKMSKSLPNLKVKQVMKPTSFINECEKNTISNPDVVIVDEAHLLLSRSDSYNSFRHDNHLEEIMKYAKVVILIFDPKQFLKLKSYWDVDLLNKIVGNVNNEKFFLKRQFRMNANTETLFWLNSLVEKKMLKMPVKKSSDFELRIFDDCQKMYEAIKSKNDEYGLSRVVSTFDYEHKKDGKDYYIEEGDFKLPWNRNLKSTDLSWAEIDNTINEVGSIYTVQGFDLNYVGVILGPSIIVDRETGELRIDLNAYKDTEAFRGDENFKNKTIEEQTRIKEQIILNSLNVLLKRGIMGVYIYVSRYE